MADITLQEYLSTSQRGILNKVFGPEFMMKSGYLQVSDIFTETFGRKVWDAMNNRTVTYNALKKVGWGPTYGWRLRTDRGSGNQKAISETGTLPTIDTSNYVTVGSPPKFSATTFGVSIKAQFMGGLEGGIGDALSVEQEAKMRDHIKMVNQFLMQGNYAYINDTNNTVFHILPVEAAGYFNIGDTVGACDANGGPAYIEATSGGAVVTVTGVDTTTGYVTCDGALNFTPAQGDTLYVLNRVTAPTSVFDVPMYDAVPAAGGHAACNIFNLTTRTNSAAYQYARGALTSTNAGVGRDLTIKTVDDAMDAVRARGGLMGLGLLSTGYSQYSAFDRLLQVHQRYQGYQTFQFGVGDEKTYPGTQVGMELATYRGIPILPDPDMPKGISSTGTALGHDILLLDLDHLELAVAMQTQYFENRNYFVANALVIQGLLFTALELRARRLDVHARITDLNA